MEKIEQMTIKNVCDVQLINFDQMPLHRKTKERIFWAKKFSHEFRVLSLNVVEEKPALFYSHRKRMFIEVFIDHIMRINEGGMVYWHEIHFKLAA